MGELSSPWREHGVDYPSNFNCTYEFETVRAEGSCYEVLLERPFGIEASANCQNDRLEIFDVLNADQGKRQRENFELNNFSEYGSLFNSTCRCSSYVRRCMHCWRRLGWQNLWGQTQNSIQNWSHCRGHWLETQMGPSTERRMWLSLQSTMNSLSACQK